MARQLGVGIVGCGNIAPVQALALAEGDGVRPAGFLSRNGAKARELGARYDVPGTDDWDAFLSLPGMDAVSVCTPSGTHLDYGRRIAEAGRHVIVEKPLEVDTGRGRALVKACRDAGVGLAVIFQNRWLPDIRELRKALDSGELGDLFLVEARVKWYRSQEYYDSGAWRGTLALDGGGVLINQAIHTLDLVDWLGGGIAEVSARTATLTHERLEGEDNAVLNLVFKSGALGSVTASTSCVPAGTRTVAFHGTRGTALLEGDRVRYLREGDDSPDIPTTGPGNATGASSPLAGFDIGPHRRQFEDIARALAEGRTPPVSGPEALRSLAAVRCAYDSAARGGSAVALTTGLEETS